MDKKDTALVIVAGAFQTISAAVVCGGILFTLLAAIKYTFTGVDELENQHLFGICAIFGIMVYLWDERPRKEKK